MISRLDDGMIAPVGVVLFLLAVGAWCCLAAALAGP